PVSNPLLISVDEAAALDILLAAAIPAGVEIKIDLNQRTAAWLLANREWVREHLAQALLRQPNYEFLKDTTAKGGRVLRAFFTQLDLPIRVSGAPACLTPHTQLIEAPKILRQEMFAGDSARIKMRELARTHVSEGYWGKSLRCRDCRLNARCDGAHINFLRDQGFAQLEPLRDGAWAEEAEQQMLP